MSDYAAAQRDEIEALQSIYISEFEGMYTIYDYLLFISIFERNIKYKI